VRVLAGDHELGVTRVRVRGQASISGTIGLDSCAAPAGPQCTTAWNLGDEVAMGKHGGAHRAGVNAALLNISPQ
jgi:hypothetical protein